MFIDLFIIVLSDVLQLIHLDVIFNAIVNWFLT